MAKPPIHGGEGDPRLWRALERHPDAIVVLDRDFDFVYANAAARRVVGLGLEEVVGRNHWDLFPALRGTEVEERYRRALTTGEPDAFEYRSPVTGRWIESRVVPDEDGLTFTLSDATARRSAAERLAAIADALPSFIANLDRDLVYRFCNRPYEAYFGRPRSEIVGRSIPELIGEASFALMRPLMERALAGESVRHEQWVDFPTGRRFVRAVYVPALDGGGAVAGVNALVSDETEARLIEERLRASEERFRRVVEAATVGIVVNDRAGTFLYANPPLLAMLGYSPEELVAGEIAWSRVQAPERRAGDDVALEQLRATGRCEPYETELVRKDGTRVPVHTGAAFVPDESGTGQLGAAFVTDLTELKAKEDALRAIARDLDARVRERTAELERANRDLNEFSYSVAHDLRAPLRAIVSTSRMLLEDAADRLEPGESALLERQVAGAKRLAQIVDDLLDFARLAKADVRRVPVDLSALAREAAEEACRRWGDRCEVRVQSGMRAVGDPSLLGYAFVNLLDNACKFSPQGGTVEVGEAAGAVFVRDQGVGFDMEHAAKLFVAFERLVDQETFPGTGVGLANVKRIVERHGGRIWAESEPGKGATFWFTLG